MVLLALSHRYELNFMQADASIGLLLGEAVQMAVAVIDQCRIPPFLAYERADDRVGGAFEDLPDFHANEYAIAVHYAKAYYSHED